MIDAYDNARLRIGSATVRFHSEGRSKRTVLLLHGLNAHSGTWRRNIPYLSKNWRTIAPTLPPSFQPFSGSLVDQYTGQVARFLAKLGISSVALVGNSLGGWIAMRIAVSNSSIVNSLVLEDTAGADLEPVVPKIDRTGLPVLIVWRENDGLIPKSVGRTLHSQVTNGELAVIEDAGHVPHWEKPDEFNRLVERFLSTLSHKRL